MTPKTYFYSLHNHGGADSYECNFLLKKGQTFTYYDIEYIVFDDYLNCGKVNDHRTYNPCPVCGSPCLTTHGNDGIDENGIVAIECSSCSFSFNF